MPFSNSLQIKNEKISLTLYDKDFPFKFALFHSNHLFVPDLDQTAIKTKINKKYSTTALFDSLEFSHQNFLYEKTSINPSVVPKFGS